MRRYTRFQLTGSEFQLACLSFCVLLSFVAIGASSLLSGTPTDRAASDSATTDRDARTRGSESPTRAVEGVETDRTDRLADPGGGQTSVGVHEHWCHSTYDAAYGRNLTDEVESCDAELQEPASIQTISNPSPPADAPTTPTSRQPEPDGLDTSDEPVAAPVPPTLPSTPGSTPTEPAQEQPEQSDDQTTTTSSRPGSTDQATTTSQPDDPTATTEPTVENEEEEESDPETGEDQPDAREPDEVEPDDLEPDERPERDTPDRDDNDEDQDEDD